MLRPGLKLVVIGFVESAASGRGTSVQEEVEAASFDSSASAGSVVTAPQAEGTQAKGIARLRSVKER